MNSDCPTMTVIRESCEDLEGVIESIGKEYTSSTAREVGGLIEEITKAVREEYKEMAKKVDGLVHDTEEPNKRVKQ